MYKRELADSENFGDALDLEFQEKDSGWLYNEIEKRLDYHYDTPAKRLMPADQNYDLYMCRTNVIRTLTQYVEKFMLLKGPEVKGVQELKIWSEELNKLATRTHDRLKTPEDMELIKSYVSRIVEICMRIK